MSLECYGVNSYDWHKYRQAGYTLILRVTGLSGMGDQIDTGNLRPPWKVEIYAIFCSATR